MMDALGRMMDRAVVGHIKDFNVAVGGDRTLSVSHLLCAEDTLVFYDVDVGKPDILGQVLIWFQVVSDLKIKLRKCEIIPVDEIGNTDLLAHVLQCRVGALPITYLGLSQVASNKDINVWNLILRGVEKRPAGWQKT